MWRLWRPALCCCMAEPEPEPEPPWTPSRQQQQQAPALGFGSWDAAIQLQSAKLLEKLSSDCKTVFVAADQDQDGKLTYAEFAMAQAQILEAMRLPNVDRGPRNPRDKSASEGLRSSV